MAAGTTEDTKLLQASEVLQSSYDIWDDDLRKKTQDDLVRMVLVEPADEVYRFANSMRLDLHPLRIMWVICPSPAESIPMAARIGQISNTKSKSICGQTEKQESLTPSTTAWWLS